jgi:hypothetical protein
MANTGCVLHVRLGDVNVKDNGNWAETADGAITGRQRVGTVTLCDQCAAPCSTPTAPRRNAQLLPSGRSLTKVVAFFLDNSRSSGRVVRYSAASTLFGSIKKSPALRPRRPLRAAPGERLRHARPSNR